MESVEVVIIEDDQTAYIMNLERRTRRLVPIWTKDQWREYIYQMIEEKSGKEAVTWLRQIDETRKNNQFQNVQPERKGEE